MLLMGVSWWFFSCVHCLNESEMFWGVGVFCLKYVSSKVVVMRGVFGWCFSQINVLRVFS